MNQPLPDYQFPLTPASKGGAHRILRVHSAEGAVYARIMEPMDMPWGKTYAMIEGIDVPAGLDQQGVVDHFRAKGWEVEQDHGTDFDNPEWGE